MNRIQKINKNFQKLKKFFSEDIYYTDASIFNPIKRFFINLFRVITFAITDFIKDDCTIRAGFINLSCDFVFNSRFNSRFIYIENF